MSSLKLRLFRLRYYALLQISQPERHLRGDGPEPELGLHVERGRVVERGLLRPLPRRPRLLRGREQERQGLHPEQVIPEYIDIRTIRTLP